MSTELNGLRAIVANAASLHGIHYEPLFTIRYYDAEGFYAQAAWYDEPSPFWHAYVLPAPWSPIADVLVAPRH